MIATWVLGSLITACVIGIVSILCIGTIVFDLARIYWHRNKNSEEEEHAKESNSGTVSSTHSSGT